MRILFNPTINPIKTSFTQRKKAVYIFNKDYEYRKYNSQQEASESLGIPISGISACAANRINSTYGYIVFNAEDIEKRDENNNIIIDVNDKQDRFNSAYKNKGNSVKKVKNGIYAVDKDGNFTKFKTKKEAAQALGLSIDVVKRCMKHNSIANGSYLLLYAEDVEKQDENGENTADLCKIKKLTI